MILSLTCAILFVEDFFRFFVFVFVYVVRKKKIFMIEAYESIKQGTESIKTEQPNSIPSAPSHDNRICIVPFINIIIYQSYHNKNSKIQVKKREVT